MSALEELKARLAELADLDALQSLAEWDLLVMMPSGGASGRAHQLGALERLTHERATAPEIEGWLQQLDGETLGDLDADIARIARRDYERASRVPGELAVELAEAHAAGQEIWQRARAEDDFGAFVPALRRNVELARRRAECVAEPGQSRYDALLSDYDFGLTTATLKPLFASLEQALLPLVQRARERPAGERIEVPLDAQRTAVQRTLARLGVEPDSWRVDVSAHPFSTWTSRTDSRITTRYSDGEVESLLSSLHEFGHALYERQVAPELDRTNLGSGTSMSIHESQSKLWENHIGRNRAFAEVLAAELDAGGFSIDASRLHAALTGVEPGLVRVSADALTYPLHIVLRFELELALIDGDLDVVDLPDAWRQGMRRLLGLEVPSDALGCMQDVHWSGGSFGYFPSYALGCVIAAQLWETLVTELGPREEDLARGETDAIQRWLGERIHRHGRRLDTLELVLAATGRELQIDPFLRYVQPLLDGDPA